MKPVDSHHPCAELGGCKATNWLLPVAVWRERGFLNERVERFEKHFGVDFGATELQKKLTEPVETNINYALSMGKI